MSQKRKYSFSFVPYIDMGRKALHPEETPRERKRWMWKESGIPELYGLLSNYFLTQAQWKEYLETQESEDFFMRLDDLMNYCLEIAECQRYIWSITDDEHGVVSVWDNKEEALEEIKEKYADGDDEWFDHRVESEDSTSITWGDDFTVTLQRQPVGESFGWIY